MMLFRHHRAGGLLLSLRPLTMSGRKKDRLSTGRITGRVTPFQLKPEGSIEMPERRSKSVEPMSMSGRGAAMQHTDIWQAKSPGEGLRSSRSNASRAAGTSSAHEDFDVGAGLKSLAICRRKINVSVGGARKKFMEFNVNKDGQLTHDEMYRGFEKLDMGLEPKDLQFLVNAFDLDGSHTIDYDEFAQTLEMSDPEMVSKVLAHSAKFVPGWQRPKKWHFTPADHARAEDLRCKIRERLWASYGDDPTAMRRAFLSLDSDRAGVLDKSDMAHSFKKLGFDFPDQDVDTLLSFYDNKRQEGGFSFHTFLQIFGAEVAGKFNPFRVDPVYPPTPDTARSGQKGAKRPEIGVGDQWMNSFGRDRRSKTVFPEVYRSKIRHQDRPKDYSDRTDVVDFDQWRTLGKVIGGEAVTPTQSSSPSRRADRRASGGSGGLPSPGGRGSLNSPSSLPMRSITKEDLVKERGTRLEQRRAEVIRTLAESRAAAANATANEVASKAERQDG